MKNHSQIHSNSDNSIIDKVIRLILSLLNVV